MATLSTDEKRRWRAQNGFCRYCWRKATATNAKGRPVAYCQDHYDRVIAKRREMTKHKPRSGDVSELSAEEAARLRGSTTYGELWNRFGGWRANYIQ